MIPIAILTTATFDAATVNPLTVTMNGAAAKVRGKSVTTGALEDVDGDGDLDLVVQIVDTDGVFSRRVDDSDRDRRDLRRHSDHGSRHHQLRALTRRSRPCSGYAQRILSTRPKSTKPSLPAEPAFTVATHSVSHGRRA